MDSPQETSPLLVDPPIDDESYRREARTFPSDEQKHLMFASYTLTSSISRFFEIISTLLMSMVFPSNLFPVTAFSFFVLASSSHSQRFAYSVARLFKSRLLLLTATITLQRISMFIFAYLVLNKEACANWLYNVVVICGLTASVILLKASLLLYHSSFRSDWLYVLSNGKDNVRLEFETSTHTVSVILQLLLPVATGLLVSQVSITDCAKILAFTATLSTLVELSLVWKLHSTCYALFLPRSSLSLEGMEHNNLVNGHLDLHPMIGVLTTPVNTVWLSRRYLKSYSRPLPRILDYARRKPIPVTVTFGVILINVSLITMGPHLVWFLLREKMNPAMVGVIKMLQTLVTLHPALSATKSFNFVAIGSVLAVLFLAMLFSKIGNVANIWTYLFGFSVVLARSGVPTINMVGDQFVEDYLADEEVHKVYKDNAAWLRTQCELLVHVLTLVFPYVDRFIYPISISAGLTLIGRSLILHMIRKHWRPEQPV